MPSLNGVSTLSDVNESYCTCIHFPAKRGHIVEPMNRVLSDRGVSVETFCSLVSMVALCQLIKQEMCKRRSVYDDQFARAVALALALVLVLVLILAGRVLRPDTYNLVGSIRAYTREEVRNPHSGFIRRVRCSSIEGKVGKQFNEIRFKVRARVSEWKCSLGI